MHEFCHRCGGELVSADSGSAFCPHCGAPQIYLPEAFETDSLSIEDSTGVLPPPAPQQVEWKTAILCGILVAFVGALFSALSTKVPAFSFINWLWTISASVIALALYQYRKPHARMDATVGARIGVVVGLILVTIIGITMATAGVVARFGLHAMGPFDTELIAQINKAATANPQPPEIKQYIYSPEFKAGIMLAGFAMLGGLILFLTTIGGAVSGLLRARKG